MKCTNCGFESEQNGAFCPNCGAAVQTAMVRENPAGRKVLSALKDPLFLVICILMSAACVLSLAADSLPLLKILFSVFLWLVYAQSRKDSVDVKHLRCVSGVAFAQYIITYVLAGLVLLLGAGGAAVLAVLTDEADFVVPVLGESVDAVTEEGMLKVMELLSGGFFVLLFVLLAAIVVVTNLFTMRYIHGFAKSVYQSVEAGALKLKYATATPVVLFVLGGISAVSCLSATASGEILLVLTGAADSAAPIIAGLLIRKYLSNDSQTEEQTATPEWTI